MTPGTNLTSYDIKLIGSATVTKKRAWRECRIGKFWWERGVLDPVVPKPYAEDVSSEVSASLLWKNSREGPGGAGGARAESC